MMRYGAKGEPLYPCDGCGQWLPHLDYNFLEDLSVCHTCWPLYWPYNQPLYGPHPAEAKLASFVAGERKT